MNHYRYILFDWDGTIARTLDIWLDALRASLEKHGHFLSDKEIGANYEIFKTHFETQKHIDVTKIINEAIHVADKNIPSVELYPHALEVLQYLQSSNKQLALVTASLHKQIDPLLKKYGMLDLFDTVVCGDDTEQIKPDAEPIKKALSDLKANSDEALIIGDSESDIRAATNAGIDSMLFYPRTHERFHNINELKLFRPTFIIHDLREIMCLFKYKD